MTSDRNKTPMHVWAVGVIALLWAAIGAFDYTMSEIAGAEYIRASGLGEAAVAWFEAIPAWMTAAWALGVWGAVAGAVLLLMRSRHAVTAFAVSLFGIVAMTVGVYFVHPYPASMSTPTGMVFEWTVKLFAAFLLWYAWKLRQGGVLR